MTRKIIKTARKQGHPIVIDITEYAKDGDSFSLEQQGENILLKKVKEE